MWSSLKRVTLASVRYFEDISSQVAIDSTMNQSFWLRVSRPTRSTFFPFCFLGTCPSTSRRRSLFLRILLSYVVFSPSIIVMPSMFPKSLRSRGHPSRHQNDSDVSDISKGDGLALYSWVLNVQSQVRSTMAYINTKYAVGLSISHALPLDY